MTIAEAKNFYKQDEKKYEIENNKELLIWLNEKIDNGYIPLMNTLKLQELINNIVTWYEIKYLERELEYYEGTINLKFLDIKKMSKTMEFKQLMYRFPHNQLCLMECEYRSGSAGCVPIYKDDKIIGYDSHIGIKIKRKDKQNCEPWELIDYRNHPHFFVFVNPVNGKVDINYALEDYVNVKNIGLEQLLLVLKNKYQNELDLSEIESCIDTHNVDVELRNKILQLAALKLLYSRNTNPERGYERAKRFINEFNKKLNLNLTTNEIDEIMKKDYTKEDVKLENEKVEQVNNSVPLPKTKVLFNLLFRRK